MHVLITGGSGYIGRALQRTLDETRKKMRISSISRSAGKDVKSRDDMITATEGVDVVFHLASISHEPLCRQNPEDAIMTNVYGTYNVLEACRINKVSWMLFPSSCHVYGHVDRLPIKEDSELKASSLYAMTKVLGEDLCRIYRQYFPITIMRFFNIYGPGQKGRVVSDFVEKARSERITIYGDAEQTLDLVHIRDVLSACLIAMEKRDSDTYNVASGTETSLNELARTVAKVVGGSVEVSHDILKSRGPTRMLADIGKIKKKLNWNPEFTLEKGIRTMV